MRNLIALWYRLFACKFKRTVFVAGLSLFMAYGVPAQDIAISEQTFGCILDWPKVRNTHMTHADPEKLKEAIRIFRDSVPTSSIPLAPSCSLCLLKQW